MSFFADRVALVQAEDGVPIGALAGLFRNVETPTSLEAALAPVLVLCAANPDFGLHPDDLMVSILVV